MQRGCFANFQRLLRPSAEDDEAHIPVVKGIVVVHRSNGKSKPGKSVVLQLDSRIHVDPTTGRGKLSREAMLKFAKKTKHGTTKTVTYRVTFRVEPGAVLVKNGHRREFFLRSATVETEDYPRVHFDCNSWVYPLSKTKAHRVF